MINGTCDEYCRRNVTTEMSTMIPNSCNITDDPIIFGNVTIEIVECPSIAAEGMRTIMRPNAHVSTGTDQANFVSAIEDFTLDQDTYYYRRDLPSVTPSPATNENISHERYKSLESPSMTASPSASISASPTVSPSQSSSPTVPWGVDEVDSNPDDDARSCTNSMYGTGVHVAVLDSGCVPQNGGFCTSSKMEGDCVDNPLSAHGTHVAGTVGSEEYGVAPNAIISCYKVLYPSEKGNSGNYLEITDMMKLAVENGANVINLSLGGEHTEEKKKQYELVVKQATAAGVFVVISSGNDKIDACKQVPANLGGGKENIFTVQAHDETGNIYSWSNFGNCTDLSAPGVDVLSTAFGGGGRELTGTSMAAPHVSGTIARMISDLQAVTLDSLTENGFEIIDNGNYIVNSTAASCN